MAHKEHIPGWVHLSSGKVRDIYAPADPSNDAELLMVTSDRISAYDFVMPTLIPDKGKILNQLAVWWMGQMEDIVPHHLARGASGDLAYATDVPDIVKGRAVKCRRLNMVPIECVVRGYLTGSGLAEYRETGEVTGIQLPQGLTEASRLEEPIFTPAAKAEVGDHDQNISFAEASEKVGLDVAHRLRELSLSLYSRARDIAAQRGLILADTKFEFGIDSATGEVVLADEILTPDSSRFWPAEEWVEGQVSPSFDKQYLRDWLVSEASGWDKASQPPALPEDIVQATRDRYIRAFHLLTGKEPQL